MTASDVMDRARKVHLNDPDAQIFTDTVLLPFVANAWETLQSELRVHGLPFTHEATTALTIPAGADSLSTVSTPPLPTDLIEPLTLYERGGSSERWIKMREINYTPHPVTPADRLTSWYWSEGEIKFFPAAVNRELLIYYTKMLIDISSPATVIPFASAKVYLAYKTGAEAAKNIGQNYNRGSDLETKAELELNKLVVTHVRGNQGVSVRRRGYNQRNAPWPTLLPY